MTTEILTKMQMRALERLASKVGGSAYSLRCTLGTLKSLKARGLATSSQGGLGSLFSPRTAIVWNITDAGRSAYRQQCVRGL